MTFPAASASSSRLFIWFLWFVWFLSLVRSANQTDQIDQPPVSLVLPFAHSSLSTAQTRHTSFALFARTSTFLAPCNRLYPYPGSSDLDCQSERSSGNVCVTIMPAEIQVLEYLDSHARSPFAAWFEGLNATAAAKVTAALYQLAGGNWSSVKGVGGGV